MAEIVFHRPALLQAQKIAFPVRRPASNRAARMPERLFIRMKDPVRYHIAPAAFLFPILFVRRTESPQVFPTPQICNNSAISSADFANTAAAGRIPSTSYPASFARPGHNGILPRQIVRAIRAAILRGRSLGVALI